MTSPLSHLDSARRARRVTWLLSAAIVFASLMASSALVHWPAHASHGLLPFAAAVETSPGMRAPVALHVDLSIPSAHSVFEKQMVYPEELPATF